MVNNQNQLTINTKVEGHVVSPPMLWTVWQEMEEPD